MLCDRCNVMIDDDDDDDAELHVATNVGSMRTLTGEDAVAMMT